MQTSTSIRDRIRTSLFPKPQPELIRFRERLARILISVIYVLLAIWLIAEIVYRLMLTPEASSEFPLSLLTIAVLTFLNTCALWLVSRHRLLSAGYLLASSFFIIATLGLILFPENIYIISSLYLISILTAGAMVGGSSSYPFAIAAAIVAPVAWFLYYSDPTISSLAIDPLTSLIFLISQIILYLGTAAILHSLSNQVERTIEYLNDQADRLTDLAQTDSLTGLANRRHLIEQLEREFVRARRYHRPLSLVYIDLDGFKALNDQHGHLFGDEILRGSARSLRAVLRSTDLLARIGGDEFAILLPETSLDGAKNVASKLRKALIAYGSQLGPAVPPLTFCAGVSQMHEDDTSIDDILARADSAQYLAKESGKAGMRTELELETHNISKDND
ncbi:MAG: diguanylate cyclase [Anaerolineales bacterium]|nr:diguanylate cyclase [Anaerolineales bacterium]